MTDQDFRKPKRSNGRGLSLLLFGGGLLLVALVGGWLLFGDGSPTTDSPRPQADAGAAPGQLREVVLYFAASSGSYLVGESRSVEGCEDEAGCIAAVVAALAAGPGGEAVRVLPEEADLVALATEGSLVSLDFDADFVAGHPGGTRSELLTVYALADTLAVNFPHLRQVRFLVDGVPLETIKGHVDLRQPIAPDFTLVREASAAGDLSNVPARSE